MLVAQLVDALRATIRYVNAWLSRNRTVARLRLVFTPRTLLLSLLALQVSLLGLQLTSQHHGEAVTVGGGGGGGAASALRGAEKAWRLAAFGRGGNGKARPGVHPGAQGRKRAGPPVWTSPFHHSNASARSPTARVSRQLLPNILLAIADDLQRSDLGSYNHDAWMTKLTPHIDSIGARGGGRTFLDAHTSSPLCTPSRLAMLTGRYASCAYANAAAGVSSSAGTSITSTASSSTGAFVSGGVGASEAGKGFDGGKSGGGAHASVVRRMVRQMGLNGTMTFSPEVPSLDFNLELSPSRSSADEGGAPLTMGHVLKEHGYATGFVGKWHLGHPRSSISTEERRRVQRASASAWKQVRESVLQEYKAVQALVRRAGFDYAERIYVNNLYPEQHVLPSAMLHHNVEWIAEGAAKFIATPRGVPFMLFVSWTLPHNPDASVSINADPRYTPGGMWACNRSVILAQRAAVRKAANASSPQPRYGHKHYPLALAWLDAGMGTVLHALRDANVVENTFTVFTSDHQAFDKRHCYTGGSQIPLLMSWPSRWAGGDSISELASHLDLAPTFYDAADVPPWERSLFISDDAATRSASGAGARSQTVTSSEAPPLPGLSLATLLLRSRSGSNSSGGHTHLFCEEACRPLSMIESRPVGQSRAVFTQRYRLIYSPQIKPIAKGGSTDTRHNYQAHRHHPAYWRPLQLYDLVEDPNEQRNLIEQDMLAVSAELSRLRSLLWNHLRGSNSSCDVAALPGVTVVPPSASTQPSNSSPAAARAGAVPEPKPLHEPLGRSSPASQ